MWSGTVRIQTWLVYLTWNKTTFVQCLAAPYRPSSRGRPVALMLYLYKRCQRRLAKQVAECVVAGLHGRPAGRTPSDWTGKRRSACRSNRCVSLEYLKAFVIRKNVFGGRPLSSSLLNKLDCRLALPGSCGRSICFANGTWWSLGGSNS